METSEKTSVEPGWVRRVVVGRSPRRTLVRLVIWVVLLFVGARLVLVPIRVEGISMLPTYHDGGVNFVNRLAYAFHPPRRGDIVAIRLNEHILFPHVLYMKRIIALPGETVEFHDGHAYINGQELPEPYVKYPCHWEHEPEVVGPDEYYVVGDNRSMGWNDHEHGRASRKQILGKILL